jgi:glycosyltransferase involved in cell wall biosynthesis
MSTLDKKAESGNHSPGPLRVLMVCHMPWRRDLGGPRVQIELADELQAQGHLVEKFSFEDAFAESKLPPALTGNLPWFATQAHRRILRSPGYDVIDAHQGNITRSKQSLGFGGSLVIRSVGLHHFYAHYQWHADPHRSPGLRHRLGRLRERLTDEAGEWAAGRSFDAADRIVVANQAEYDFLQLNPRWGKKARILPIPISQAGFSALSSAPRQGLHSESPTVAFVGSWHPRKGSRDWPRLVPLLSAQLPGVRLRFLGTGVEPADPGLPRDVVWVPHYEPDDLPGLLAGVDLGVFPSYLEGFPIAVVEQLAAAVPVVAYDIPGPRDILCPVDPTLLVQLGDLQSLARRVVDLLSSEPEVLDTLRDRCTARAKELTWGEWIGPILRCYSREDGAGS